MPNKYRLITLISIISLILIWKISALIVGADIILPPPEKVLLSILNLFNRDFLKTVSATLIRGVLGFLISLISGLIIGIIAGLKKGFREFIKPFLGVIRSTPVISVILLALIWFSVDSVPIFVSFLMAFPIVCINVIEGLSTVDKKLLEMAKLYKVNKKDKLLKIYIPSILPFIISGASISLGLVWKVVVAAEVLSQPKLGIGTSLNEAKAFLLTEEVFAWTIIALVLSYLTELIFNLISNIFNWRRDD